MKTLLLVLVCLMGATACDELLPESAAPRDDTPRAAPAGRPPPKRAERAARIPEIRPRPKVHLKGLDGSDHFVKRAIVDLKAVGLWDELTDHLYRIEVLARAGKEDVPLDRHLADARFWRQRIARGTYDYPDGSFCRIRMFPRAITDDLVRWRSYYAQGVTPEVPPTRRQFWATILGHELGHCPKQGNRTASEEVAQAWERRVLGALRAAGVE